MADKDLSYEKIKHRWGDSGIFKPNVPFDVVVSFLTNVMDTKELVFLTGESPSSISRMKTGKSTLRIDSLQKIYRFYLDISQMPVNAEITGDLIPLYNSADVRQVLSSLQSMSSTIETALKDFKRQAQTKLREVRDNAPEQAIDLNEFAQKQLSNHDLKEKQTPSAEKPEHTQAAKQEQKQPAKTTFKPISIKSYRNDRNERIITDDGRSFFLAPENMDTMQKELGYLGKNADQFKYLTLNQRYLLEFYELMKCEPLNKTANEQRAKMQGEPEIFWTFHTQYGIHDNQWLRQRDSARCINGKKSPLFNTIEDVRLWEERLMKYYYENNIDDPNYHHEAHDYGLDENAIQKH